MISSCRYSIWKHFVNSPLASVSEFLGKENSFQELNAKKVRWLKWVKAGQSGFQRLVFPKFAVLKLFLLVKSNGNFAKDMKPERFAMTCCTEEQSNQEGVDGENLVSANKAKTKPFLLVNLGLL